MLAAGQRRGYFEECDEPLIAGIGWVFELIGIAGGGEIFRSSTDWSRKERIVMPEQVVERRSEIIIGSWRTRFVAAMVRKRPGLAIIPAVERGEFHEIKSTIILRSGSANRRA